MTENTAAQQPQPEQPPEYYVYLLVEENRELNSSPGQGSRATYVGLTRNVQDRFSEHNSGKCRATKKRNWKLLCWATCENILQARQLEKWLKIGNSRNKRIAFYQRLRRQPGNYEGSQFFISQAKRYFATKELRQKAHAKGLGSIHIPRSYSPQLPGSWGGKN